MSSLAERINTQAQGVAGDEAVAILLVNAMDGRLLEKLLPAVVDDPRRGRAWVDWLVAIGIPDLTGTERCLVELAASLATNDVTINLFDTLSGLDPSNGRLAVQAIAHLVENTGLLQRQYPSHPV